VFQNERGDGSRYYRYRNETTGKSYYSKVQAVAHGYKDNKKWVHKLCLAFTHCWKQSIIVASPVQQLFVCCLKQWMVDSRSWFGKKNYMMMISSYRQQQQCCCYYSVWQSVVVATLQACITETSHFQLKLSTYLMKSVHLHISLLLWFALWTFAIIIII
jgi:hypothetical protein